MRADAETIALLGPLLKEHVGADVACIVASRLDMGPAEAMDAYFSSPVAPLVEEGSLGVQYLDAGYLADIVIAHMRR